MDIVEHNGSVDSILGVIDLIKNLLGLYVLHLYKVIVEPLGGEIIDLLPECWFYQIECSILVRGVEDETGIGRVSGGGEKLCFRGGGCVWGVLLERVI